MPHAYEKLKKKYGAKKAARIYVGGGKTKAARSRRAKSLKHK
jgi:hypothetical protein